jgi:hypothetical protein
VLLISYLVIMPSSPQILFISLISTREAASDGEAEEQCAIEAQEEEAIVHMVRRQP